MPQIDELMPFSDWEIDRIIWTNGGQDMLFDLRVHKKEGEATVTLLFQHVALLEIGMRFKDYIGFPFLCMIDMKNLPGGRKWVCFNFGWSPEGAITFECNSASVVE